MGDERANSQRKQGRLAFFVIIATGIVWVGINLTGPALGLPVRFAFLADFAALAAFLWAFLVLLRVWRGQSREGS